MNWSEAYWFLGARSSHWPCRSPLMASTNPIIFGPKLSGAGCKIADDFVRKQPFAWGAPGNIIEVGFSNCCAKARAGAGPFFGGPRGCRPGVCSRWRHRPGVIYGPRHLARGLVSVD